MSHAPHRSHMVFINEGVFSPPGVDKVLLRAEAFHVNQERRIYLKLSDYYADEYSVYMGTDSPGNIEFVRDLVENHRYCHIKSHTIKRKESGETFCKPIVVTTNDTSFFKP